jgi:hypothetical protein
MCSSLRVCAGRLQGGWLSSPVVGPLVFILVFLILPLGAGLLLFAFVAVTLVAKAVAAIPLAVWGLIAAVSITGGAAWRRSGRRRPRDVDTGEVATP